jgi:hypothetical protein
MVYECNVELGFAAETPPILHIVNRAFCQAVINLLELFVIDSLSKLGKTGKRAGRKAEGGEICWCACSDKRND